MNRILLIEDDPRIVAFVKRGLEAEGYPVDVVEDGDRAVAAGSGTGYDVILLDLTLPGMDGTEVCRALRARKVATAILMLTARDLVEDRVDGLRAGADDYLTKPFSFDELLARIEALRRRPPVYQEEVSELEVGSLKLDRDSRTVTRDGRAIELSPREFAMLEFLMVAPGRVRSRPRILEAVWGYSSDPLTNVVEVCMSQLRKKLGDGDDQRLIHTVRGFGYKIEA